MPDHFEENAGLLAHGHPTPEPHFLYDAVSAFVAAAEPLRMLPETDKRSLASGIWVLAHYFKTYLQDPYVIYSDSNGPFVERTFSTPFYESERFAIELFGTIDFVFQHEVTGHLLPGDHKTSSQLGNDFFNRLKPNHQYTGYIVGAESMGISGSSFLVNALQVKPRPLTARGGPPTFTRQITTRTAQDIAEFREVVIWAAQTYIRAEESGVWPLGPADACANYGGCTYLDVCSAPGNLRQNILEAKFERKA